MYEKLGVKKPRKGEELNHYDAQKVGVYVLLFVRLASSVTHVPIGKRYSEDH